LLILLSSDQVTKRQHSHGLENYVLERESLFMLYFVSSVVISRSQWPRGLRRGSTAGRLQGIIIIIIIILLLFIATELSLGGSSPYTSNK